MLNDAVKKSHDKDGDKGDQSKMSQIKETTKSDNQNEEDSNKQKIVLPKGLKDISYEDILKFDLNNISTIPCINLDKKDNH